MAGSLEMSSNGNSFDLMASGRELSDMKSKAGGS